MVTKKSKRERPTERLSGIIDRLDDFNLQLDRRRGSVYPFEPRKSSAQALAGRLMNQSLSQQESNIVRKIEKLEEITVKDQEYLKKHPGRLGELQRIIKEIQTNFEIGQLNFDLKKYEDASVHFRRARGSPIVFPKINSESLYLELTCELEAQRDDATPRSKRRLLQRAMALTEMVPSNGDYWALQGDIAVKILDEEKPMTDAIEHNVLGTQPWRKIITPDTAISAYLKALKVGVSTAMSWSDGANMEEHVHHSLGKLYLEQDVGLSNASKHFKKLILLHKARQKNEMVDGGWLSDPYEHLAEIAEKQGKWKLAIKYLQKGHKVDPQNAPETLQNIGSNYGELGEYKKSVEYYDLSLKELVTWIDYGAIDAATELKTKIYFNKHISLTKLNRLEDAIACLNLLLLDKPKNSKALERKAQLEFELGYHECSLATSKLIMEVDGKTARNLSNHALSLAKLQRGDEALKILEESLTIDPNNLGALHLKRDILESNDKYDDAEKLVDKSIKLQDSKHQNYHKTKLLFLKALQSNNLRIAKKALHVQDKNIKKFKIKIEEDMLECMVRVDILFLLKRNLQCMKLLKIIEKDEVQVNGKPSYPTLYKMITILVDLKRPKEIDKFFTKYEKSVNNQPELMSVRALHNDSLGRYDLALNDLAFVVMSEPELKNHIKHVGFSKKLMSDKRYKLMMK